MRFSIDKSIIDKTTKCNLKFGCLSGDESCLCKVKLNISNNIKFIECTDTIRCNYMVPFADGNVCTCPTRKAIYRQYHM